MWIQTWELEFHGVLNIWNKVQGTKPCPNWAFEEWNIQSGVAFPI
jgi:hypothetical protein